MVSIINAFEPNIVFVGMTAPKQEKWSLQHRDMLNSNLVISIGNVFDWYALRSILFSSKSGWPGWLECLSDPKCSKEIWEIKCCFFGT
jgi:N-acetylglucosaminyldiphosphoundecaprenol N-acetyl-beta-D-mannosaminyltransferase